jgi:hypothetical protein
MSASRSSFVTDADGRAARRSGSAVKLLAVAAIPALVLLFFAQMAFTNLILARGDTFLYFYPYWQMAADALRAGHLPLWNPHIFMGVPFIANSQVGFFYPLNWPVWLLRETPYAVSASILIHLMIAGLGVYLLARRVLRLSPAAALGAAVLFALGGYLTAQVEHVNQVQGLAWLPWLLVVVGPVVGRSERPPVSWRIWLRAVLLTGGLFAMQLLAGHTQTAFISGVAISLWLLVHLVAGRSDRHYGLRLAGLLAPAVAVAGLLAAVQLLPTLELTSYSARQGGLSLAEVLSFSWHPLHITRSLLPGVGQSLFSEYVAFLPLTALVLAVVGGWRWRGRPEVVALLVLAAAGLVLALGRFTPIYWLLANLPGFDLFRVPARWLVLYALAVALLAGVGWEALAGARPAGDWPRRPLLVGLTIVAALMIWGFAAGLLAGVIPTGAEAPFERPNAPTVVLWAGELMLLALLLIPVWRGRRLSPAAGAGLLVLGGVVLFIASRDLSYNHLTTPEAYFDIRPPAARLQALAACEVPAEPCRTPPDRFLSLSDTFFDPGDQAEIDTIYGDQLDTAARYDYTIAIKQKEIVAPNLPMVYGLYTVDGFDGGILPLAAYSNLMQLILPGGEITADGRLREYLTAVPETRWLDLFNTRYIITDKVGDVWREGFFFDRQFPVRLDAGETAAVGYVPPFAADALWLLTGDPMPAVTVATADGQTLTLQPELLAAPDLYQVALPVGTMATAITVTCPSGSCGVAALTLVDRVEGAFQPVVLGPFRQIHSGDVKLYEYLAAAPRARLLYEWQWQPDEAAALAALAAPGFDPSRSAVLTGAGERPSASEAGDAGAGAVVVTEYAPEHIALRVSAVAPGVVVLADTFYPGWTATLNGQPAPLVPANGLFRGVLVPGGQHDLQLTYTSMPFERGRLITLLAVAVSLIVLSWLVWSQRRGDAP